MNRDDPYFKRVKYLQISNDARYLAATNNDYDPLTAVWEIGSGELKGVHPGWAWGIINGTDYLLLRDRNKGKIVSIEQKNDVKETAGPPVLSSEGNFIYSVTGNGTVRVWYNKLRVMAQKF